MQQTMSASQTNCRESCFQHPSLAKIHGDPTHHSLAKNEKECSKANEKSVGTPNLGGSLQGHLGLAGGTLACKRVSSGVPFLRPVLPVLPGLAQSTTAQIAKAMQIYTHEMDIFKACNLIK
jgi:hypothetical protein